MIELVLYGKVSAGKNNMGVTRTGVHFPRPAFRKWRDAAVVQVLAQVAKRPLLSVPLRATVCYYPGDLRRRDMPAIIDGVWHVLERSGVVKDDALIHEVDYTQMPLDRKNPRLRICLQELINASGIV